MALLGRNGVVLKGATQIGDVKNVSVSISADIIKEYLLGSDTPAVLESGNKSFSVSIEKMYIDSTYATDVLNGSKVTIEVRPNGTGAGKPKITLNNVVFNSWDFEVTQDGLIAESISGEATSIAFGTQS